MTTPSEVKRQIIEELEAHKNKVWDKAIEEGWNAELATHAHWLHDNALEFTDAIRLVSSMEFPDEPEPNWCVYCNGNGFTVEMEDGPNLDEYQKECRKCNGTGTTPAAPAPVTKELESLRNEQRQLLGDFDVNWLEEHEPARWQLYKGVTYALELIEGL